ncbi:hypothetical protein LXL04_032845 [Taraxacum kok-saghyz]
MKQRVNQGSKTQQLGGGPMHFFSLVKGRRKIQIQSELILLRSMFLLTQTPTRLKTVTQMPSTKTGHRLKGGLCVSQWNTNPWISEFMSNLLFVGRLAYELNCDVTFISGFCVA